MFLIYSELGDLTGDPRATEALNIRERIFAVFKAAVNTPIFLRSSPWDSLGLSNISERKLVFDSSETSATLVTISS